MTRLVILSWPDYIDPATPRQFEQAFGVGVATEIVPSAVELVERMRWTEPGVDVLCPPDYAVRELAAENRLLPLDHSQLPNLENLEPRFQIGRAHDPESRVSVLKDWGTTGFMVRTDVVQEGLQSWADFWRAAGQHSGSVTVLDSPGEVIGAALKMRGHSYNSCDPEDLRQARDDLLDLKQHLLAFETDYKPLLRSGAACISLGWNGDAAALKAEGVPVRYVVPSEGSQLWEDDWAISRSTREPEAAMQFLNFVLRSEVAAQEARYTRYATGNRRALELLAPEMHQDPSTYPPQAVLERLEPGTPHSPEGQARRDLLWRQVRG